MASSCSSERLLNAVKERRADLVRELIRVCSLSSTDWAGQTALHIAAFNGDYEIALILIKNGANVNSASKLKKTPLHFASQNGHLKIVELLVENGAHLDSVDMLKMTALHWSVERGHFKIVDFFCNRVNTDLDFMRADKFERSCMDIAIRKNDAAILDLLKNSRVGEKNSPSLNESLKALEIFLKDNSQFNPGALDNNSTRLSRFTATSAVQNKKVISSKKYRYEIVDDSDLNTSGEEDADNESQDEAAKTKKQKISFSPVQNIEDILVWLKSQENLNDADFLENRQLSLTDAGRLTLEYLNKMDPIGDERRLLMKLVKSYEENEKMQRDQSENTEEINETSEMFNDNVNLDDWFLDTDFF